ncbi:hypothetical protein ACJJTC_008720 [Scirpophaga incertulas]
MSGSYMAAYSGSSGFVTASKTGRLFNTPPEDPVVVVAKCTRVMLEGEVLAMAKTMASESLEGAAPGSWADTAIEWVNGVPGCGKTEWVTSRIDIANDIAVTTTLEAANDLRERLALRKGYSAKHRVRTMGVAPRDGGRITRHRSNRERETSCKLAVSRPPEGGSPQWTPPLTGMKTP